MTKTEFVPNQGQQEAIDKFMAFMFSPAKGFRISGPAGTGKTATMKHFIEKTIPAYQETCKLMGIKPEFDSVQMTATTNKAAEVLGQATGYPTSTIHSYIRVKVSEDHATGKMRLTKNNDFRVNTNKVIFIDEASMIDTTLNNLINEAVEKTKLVFVGDKYQLAPIYEKLSPVYLENYEEAELTQQMRNNTQPALMELCDQLRETVKTGVFKPIRLVPGVVDHILDNAELQRGLEYLFKEPTKDHKIIAYTNNQVRAYNYAIRDLRGLTSEFQLGEQLIVNTPFKIGSAGRTVPAEEEWTLVNIKKRRESLQVTPDIEFFYNLCDMEDSFGEKTYDVKVPVDMDHYYDIVRYLSKEKKWDEYFAFKNSFPDLRTMDAATTHKSQGSTYKSVIIDLEDISLCRDADQAARLLYVAFSRAKDRVYIRGNLAEKFGGLDAKGYY